MYVYIYIYIHIHILSHNYKYVPSWFFELLVCEHHVLYFSYICTNIYGCIHSACASRGCRDPHRVSLWPPGRGGLWTMAVTSLQWYGHGSKAMMPYLGGWTSIYDLFWGSQMGTSLLTHGHMMWVCHGLPWNARMAPHFGPFSCRTLWHYDIRYSIFVFLGGLQILETDGCGGMIFRVNARMNISNQLFWCKVSRVLTHADMQHVSACI